MCIAHPVPSCRARAQVRDREFIARFVLGCAAIFVDMGSNIGMHSRFLFEPHMYNKSAYARTFPIRLDGVDRLSTCVLAFEPNPKHERRQRALERMYTSQVCTYI